MTARPMSAMSPVVCIKISGHNTKSVRDCEQKSFAELEKDWRFFALPPFRPRQINSVLPETKIPPGQGKSSVGAYKRQASSGAHVLHRLAPPAMANHNNFRSEERRVGEEWR